MLSRSPAASLADRWRALPAAAEAALLVALALALFLPGLAALPPMDRDEPRFAQATRQMLETGDLVDIRFQDEPRHKKPVGIHWMQAASVSLGAALGVPDARGALWLYRLPSTLGAVLVVLGTWGAGLALGGRRVALLGGALAASAIMLGVEARLAKTDAVLSGLIALAFAALARAWMERRAVPETPDRLWLAFWLPVALAVLVKGPVAPMILGLAAGALSVHARSARWLARLRPGRGLALVVFVAAPWFLAIAWRSGGAFFAEAVGKDLLAKVGSGQESHGAPPGTYLVAALGTAWPVWPFALAAAPFAWRARRDDAVAFLLAWLIPAWLVFEAVPTKLPHYVLPLYPALALLPALALARDELGPRWRRLALAGLPVLALALLLAVGLGGWWFDRLPPFLALPWFAVAFGAAAFAMLTRVPARGVAFAVLASGLVAAGFFVFAAPALRVVQLSPRLAQAAVGVACEGPRYATAGYREPSLVFLTRTDLAMTDGAGAAAFLAAGGCRIAFVEAREEPAFLAAGGGGAPAPALVTRVEGINLNGGRRLDVAVYARTR